MAAAPPLLDALRAALKARQPAAPFLYAVMDGARDLGLALEAGATIEFSYRTLFYGPRADEHFIVAPHLLAVDPDGWWLGRFVEEIGNSTGILLGTTLGPDAIWRHLREIFVVTDEEGDTSFFRFYDPRVLRTYLPTCTPDEVRLFFGPMQWIVAEDEAGLAYEAHEVSNRQLTRTAIHA